MTWPCWFRIEMQPVCGGTHTCTRTCERESPCSSAQAEFTGRVFAKKHKDSLCVIQHDKDVKPAVLAAEDIEGENCSIRLYGNCIRFSGYCQFFYRRAVDNINSRDNAMCCSA